jgi:hypothetical protein
MARGEPHFPFPSGLAPYLNPLPNTPPRSVWESGLEQLNRPE